MRQLNKMVTDCYSFYKYTRDRCYLHCVPQLFTDHKCLWICYEFVNS